MRHGDITDDVSNRFDLPASHPFLTRIAIDPVDWFRFQELDIDNPATRILGYDEPRDGVMVLHVACASRATRARLEDGWS